jgi:hypothetical protein
VKRFAIAGVLIVAAACSQDPYTAADGRDDLVAAGWAVAEAECAIDGLDAYFRDEFVSVQEAEGIPRDAIPEIQIDLYVKNQFARVSDVPADLAAEAERLASACRT